MSQNRRVTHRNRIGPQESACVYRCCRLSARSRSAASTETLMAEDQLKRFGDALANSASALFEGDEKEVFVRILLDLSVQDLETLNHDNLKGWLPATRRIERAPDVLSSLLTSRGQRDTRDIRLTWRRVPMPALVGT